MLWSLRDDCLSAARSMSLKQEERGQSCFRSSISICTRSSRPRKRQTCHTSQTGGDNSGDDEDGRQK